MPPIKKHVEISTARTGQGYQEIHEWIDEEGYKDQRHDITKIPENFVMFKDKYGEEAAQEYVQHLADDLKGKFGHLLEDVQEMMDKTLAYFGAVKP